MKKTMFIQKSLLTVALSFISLIPAFSGNPGPGYREDKEWKEKILAEKIAFFTSELELTPEEAQVFWPVYNQLQDERAKYHHEARTCMKLLEASIDNGDDESEIKALLDNYIEAAEKCDNMRKKTHEEISKVLSERKTAKLFITEERFMMKKFKSLKEKN